ncbi:hypothetical protein [Pseudomonas viridiflava]|uniref:hypothetical protein n=1 Tax=Pseudomonas viridiflava TaxID=33069 RepID=UPI000F035B46|nr:hypothetical protein [Pseudomonas viridiflava]
MAETVNIGEIAEKLIDDIFSYFFWEIKPRTNENFECHCPHHQTPSGDPKSQHPCDLIFHYQDPYLGSTIYLHTDLKSYAKESITKNKIRDAFKSLGMTIECARQSQSWCDTFSIDTSEEYEVRGLLFVHNHDHEYRATFSNLIEKVGFDSIPIPENVCLHWLGPDDILRMVSIGNDIMRLVAQKKISSEYSFYYPDLVMRHRQGDVWAQPATVEALTSPYVIIQHKGSTDNPQVGYVVYYNRTGASSAEFEYFLDSLSRYQMLESNKTVQIRVTARDPHKNLVANFNAAKEKYARVWGFDPIREQVLGDIKITTIPAMVDGYSPGWMGWRE